MKNSTRGLVQFSRPALHFRVIFSLLGVAIVFIGVLAESTDPADSDPWRVGAAAMGFAIAAWPHLVRVELHDAHVRLRGVVRIRLIPLADLARVQAGQMGLLVVRRGGGTVFGSTLVGRKAPFAS